MKLYKEVKASERLPEEGREVAVIYNNGLMCGGIYGKGSGFYDAYGYNIPDVEYWLEPIEITEDISTHRIIIPRGTTLWGAYELGWKTILSKLKGE